MRLDVLIIGGGPAGATTGLLLAKAGWSVGLVEKKSFPRRKVCGEFISATSLPLLHQLGLVECYLEHSGPEIKRVGLFSADTVLTAKMPKANCKEAKWGRTLGREHLDTALLNNAMRAGVKIWQPAEATKIERKDDLFFCTLKDKLELKTVSSSMLILANGSWEKSIERAENKIHKPSDLLAFKAYFTNAHLPQDLMPLLAFPGGYGGMVNNAHHTGLSCCVRRDVLQSLRQNYPGLQAGEAVIEYIKSSCRGVQETLENAQRQASWLGAGPIQPGIRQRFKDDIFYVGNIAGEAHPIIAEGISMAMQSGWLLAQVLNAQRKEILSTRRFDKAGQKYSKQWQKYFANRIRASALFSSIAMMNPWAVSLFTPLFKQFPAILTLGAKFSGKIQQVVPDIE